jgi:ABC-type cobalamin/Fe3+-siderophores transport system ATPase subunit
MRNIKIDDAATAVDNASFSMIIEPAHSVNREESLKFLLTLHSINQSSRKTNESFQ